MKTLARTIPFSHAVVCWLSSHPQGLVIAAFVALLAAPTCVQAESFFPKIERIAKGSPNAPYVVRGVKYKPLNADIPFKQRGIASWYGGKFHGRLTASGEVYDKQALTAAHPTLPLPSYVRVRHIRTGREVIVRVNDRGPYHGHRIIDLSRAAADALGVQGSGTAEVEIERLTFDDIRTGRWKSPDTSPSEEAVAIASTEETTNEATLLDSGKDAPLPQPNEPHWLQLGTFTDANEAEEARQSIASHWGIEQEPPTTLVQKGTSIRLLMGPFSGVVQAAMAAREVRARLQLTPVILQ